MGKILNEVGLEYFWGKVKAFVNAGLDKKVTAVSGKGLSSNDLTDALKSNYDAAYNHAGAAHAPTDAQANVIESVTVNGVKITPTNKTVNVSVPTTVAGLSDAGNYALKSDISTMYKYKGSVATFDDLPASATVTNGDVYNVETDGMNYAWNGTAWDALGGSVQIDAITNAEIDAIVK